MPGLSTITFPPVALLLRRSLMDLGKRRPDIEAPACIHGYAELDGTMSITTSESYRDFQLSPHSSSLYYYIKRTTCIHLFVAVTAHACRASCMHLI